MSRSYKKNPIIKYGPEGNYGQKIANRKLRRKLNKVDDDAVGNKSNAYKKEYEQWDIHDVISRWTREDAIKYYNDIVNNPVERWPGEKENFIKDYPTLEKWLSYWEKCMKRK